MRYLLTSLLCVFTLSLTAQEVVTYPYNPDEDVNGLIASPDLLGLLAMYGEVFSPGEIQIDGVSLLEVIQDLQNQINNNALPDGIMSGDILRWNGTAWIPESPPVDECGVTYGDNSTCFTSCGDLVAHEGYNYSTVQIGDQCWFSENCRYLPSVSPSSASSTSTPYYYVHGYEGTDVTAAQATSNYATYGVLYNWPAVMTEDVCPSGWHIP